MTEAILDLRPARNTSSDLSPEQKRTIKFYAYAHMTAEEIAARAWVTVQQVLEYCDQSRINVK